MPDRRILAVAFVLTACSLAVLWLTDVPLGVPGEWEWSRIAAGRDQLQEGLVGAMTAAIGAVLYLAVVWLGAKRLLDCTRIEAGTWLAVLLCIAFGWLWIVQQSPTQQNRLQKFAFVLYYRGSSGYFYEARHETRPVPAFLAAYEDKMREGDVLHIGTHPPGLFLLHRGLIQLVERSPALTRFLNQTQPREVDQMFNEIERFDPLLPRDRAAIWLASLLTQLAAVATVLPIYLLLRAEYSRATSWLTSALWPLVPALAVFLPKSDAVYPLLAMTFLLCWYRSFHQRSAIYGSLAGLCLFGGLLLSLALIPVIVMAGLWTCWRAWCSRPEASLSDACRALAGPLIGLTLGFFTPVIALWLCFDFNSLMVWWLNYQNHAGFYDQYTRTYWKWLVVNAFELAYGVGVPVTVLMLAAWMRLRSSGSTWRSERLAPYLCCAAVWGLLWISGKNMGEAARLWLVMMPWPIWLSAAYFDEGKQPAAAHSSTKDNALIRRWLPFGVLQAIACAVTVLAVYGFRT